MLTIPDRWLVIRKKCYPHSANWYYHHGKLAESVRKWRETNTLKLVK